MSGERWKGRMSEILDTVAEAGYQGFETEFWFLGGYGRDAGGFRRLLEERRLALVSLGVVGCWTDPAKTDEELAAAREVVDYLADFPRSSLLIAGGTSNDRDAIERKFQGLFDCLHRIGEYGADKGIQVGFHPHSHHGSIFASEADYERFLDETDPALVRFIPDVGHMARTGVDPAAMLRRAAERILLVHFKDFDGQSWIPMGQGKIDWAGVVRALRASDYGGWVVVEDESPGSVEHPADVVRANRSYLKSLGL